jgi:peptide/nickel transport system permease protein
MYLYILKRLLLAIPTLMVIALITFWLGDNASRVELGNTANHSIEWMDISGEFPGSSVMSDRSLPLLPAFYWSAGSSLFPDTLHRIFPVYRRKLLMRNALKLGSWNLACRWERKLLKMTAYINKLPSGQTDRRCLQNWVSCQWGGQSETLPNCASADSFIVSIVSDFNELLGQSESGLGYYNRFMPRLSWNGTGNRFHVWISGLVRGDLGKTRLLKQSVADVLRPSFWSTFIVSFFGFVIGVLWGVPLGVQLSGRVNVRMRRWLRFFTLILYSMPLMVLGTIFLSAFVSDSAVVPLIKKFNITPFEGGVWDIGVWFIENLPVLILPVLALGIHMGGIITIQVEGGLKQALGEDYIRTARAKGVEEEAVFWIHALKNAIFPLITTLGIHFPSVFMGSVVIERLFGFNGLGSRLFEAIDTGDTNVLMAIVVVVSLVGVISNIISDLFYYFSDARVWRAANSSR